MRDDDEQSNVVPFRPRAEGDDSGSGKRGGRTRVGSGSDDDYVRRIDEAIRAIEAETGRLPTFEEVVVQSKLPVRTVASVLVRWFGHKNIEGASVYGSEVGEDLVKSGLLTPEEWELVQEERLKFGEPISLILQRLGLATENHLKNALELRFGVNYVSLNREVPNSECLKLLPLELLHALQLVPVSMEKNSRLTLAMVNPNDLAALDKVKSLLPGMSIKPVVCIYEDFIDFLKRGLQPSGS